MKRLFTLSLCLILVCSLGAENINSLKQKQEELQKQIQETNKMLSQTKKDKQHTLNKLTLLGQNIKAQRQIISTLDSEIGILDGKIASVHSQRDSLQKRLDKLSAEYAYLVRQQHYAQSQQSPLLFILSAQDFQQLFRRIQYVEQTAESIRELAQRIVRMREDLAVKQNELEGHRQEKATVLKEQKIEQTNLARDEKKQKDMLGRLKKQEKNLGQQLKNQQKKVTELNNKIADLIRQQASQDKNGLTKEQQLVAGDFEKNKGRLPWPVEKGFISGYFGKHQHPVHEKVIVDNKGIFLQTTAGSDARAVFKGEVTSCFMMNKTYAVIIQHGNYRTVYCGLSSLYVKQGDKVETKQKLGKIYTDAEQDNKTEMQFQIYQDRTLLNPCLWIAQ